MPAASSAERREEHVRRFIEGRGVADPRVLAALRAIPRERFAGTDDLEAAYGDHPLPIGCGQTISQPYVVAWMTEALRLTPSDRVLEIGTGSGYQTAVLARLVDRVFTIEYHAFLSVKAGRELARMEGLCPVSLKAGDGSLGWPEEAPFDAICVTAGAPRIPSALCAQLAENGRLVVPAGGRDEQNLLLVVKSNGKLRTKRLGGCRFVPLWGTEGWGNPCE